MTIPAARLPSSAVAGSLPRAGQEPTENRPQGGEVFRGGAFAFLSAGVQQGSTPWAAAQLGNAQRMVDAHNKINEAANRAISPGCPLEAAPLAQPKVLSDQQLADLKEALTVLTYTNSMNTSAITLGLLGIAEAFSFCRADNGRGAEQSRSANSLKNFLPSEILESPKRQHRAFLPSDVANPGMREEGNVGKWEKGDSPLDLLFDSKTGFLAGMAVKKLNGSGPPTNMDQVSEFLICFPQKNTKDPSCGQTRSRFFEQLRSVPDNFRQGAKLVRRIMAHLQDVNKDREKNGLDPVKLKVVGQGPGADMANYAVRQLVQKEKVGESLLVEAIAINPEGVGPAVQARIGRGEHAKGNDRVTTALMGRPGQVPAKSSNGELPPGQLFEVTQDRL